MLVIPYTNIKLDIFPGSVINKCKANYREKIENKGVAAVPGSAYNQKCVGIPNFKAFCFVNVGNGKSD